jgi:uncharacterized repeat protein (TIGR03803 family)
MTQAQPPTPSPSRCITSTADERLRKFRGRACKKEHGMNPKFGFSLLASAILCFGPCTAAVAQLPTSATETISIPLATDGSQGGNPYDNLIQASDGNLYGAAECGGTVASGLSQCDGNLNSSAGGAIFSITPAGVYSIAHSFSGSDGAVPDSLIELPDGNLYGITVWGGANGYGTLYKMAPGGSGFTIVYSFTNGSDGANPIGRIVYGSDGYIYGTTTQFANGTESGTLWRFKVNGATFSTIFHFSGDNETTLGTKPYGGVTKVGTKLYGTSQNVGASGYGALWYVESANDTGVLLHTFANGADGANPLSAPRLDGDGFLYGTTQGSAANGPDSSVIYQSGLTSGFTEIEDFPAESNVYLDGGITFDNNGYLYTTSFNAGATNYGELLDVSYVDSVAASNTLYSFGQADAGGSNPASAPFLDNLGRMWTEQLFGAASTVPFGGIAAFTLTPALAAPITITSSAPTVAPNTNITISWQGHNLFSDDEQVCFATQTPQNAGVGTAWSGIQTGTYTGKVLSGSKGAISFPATGDYVMAITCGGTESALLTEHVRFPSATNLTATPSTVAEGGNTTFTASVTGNGSAATGIVTLTVGGVALGTIDLSKTHALGVKTTGIAPGVYTVTASYPGDIQYDPSTGSTTLTITSGSAPVATTTTLTASPNPVAAGNNVTLAATVKKTSGTGAPTGTVTFKTGTTVLATVPLNGSGVASLTASTTGYPKGSYPIVATYNGDANDNASSSATLNVIIATKTTSALTVSPASGPVGTTFTLTDTVTPTSGTVSGNVGFYTGTTLLANVALSGGKAVLKAPSTGYPAGTYVIRAVYAGNSSDAGSTSNNVSITLTK